MGGTILAALCKRLEVMGRSGALDGAHELVGELRTGHRALCTALEQEIEKIHGTTVTT